MNSHPSNAPDGMSSRTKTLAPVFLPLALTMGIAATAVLFLLERDFLSDLLPTLTARRLNLGFGVAAIFAIAKFVSPCISFMLVFSKVHIRLEFRLLVFVLSFILISNSIMCAFISAAAAIGAPGLARAETEERRMAQESFADATNRVILAMHAGRDDLDRQRKDAERRYAENLKTLALASGAVTASNLVDMVQVRQTLIALPPMVDETVTRISREPDPEWVDQLRKLGPTSPRTVSAKGLRNDASIILAELAQKRVGVEQNFQGALRAFEHGLAELRLKERAELDVARQNFEQRLRQRTSRWGRGTDAHNPKLRSALYLLDEARDLSTGDYARAVLIMTVQVVLALELMVIGAAAYSAFLIVGTGTGLLTADALSRVLAEEKERWKAKTNKAAAVSQCAIDRMKKLVSSIIKNTKHRKHQNEI